MSLSPADQLVLRTIEFLAPSHWSIVERAMVYRSVFRGFAQVSTDEMIDSVRSLLQREWIQVVEHRMLSSIRSLLAQKNCHGPIFGLPHVGSLDFTQLGAL